MVHELAEEYLHSFATLRTGRNKEIEEHLEAHPLLGLEISDEALVLLKNDPSRYAKANLALIGLTGQYRRFKDRVTTLRDGRPRLSTTPSLRGGGTREAPDCDVCGGSCAGGLELFSSDDMRRFVAKGFVPDEPVMASVMKERGLTRAEAAAAWNSEVVGPATGAWRLCTPCATKARATARE
jgi:hypothetical protein